MDFFLKFKIIASDILEKVDREIILNFKRKDAKSIFSNLRIGSLKQINESYITNSLFNLLI